MSIDVLSGARDVLSRSGNDDDEAEEELRAVVTEAVREAMAEAEAEPTAERRRFRRTRSLLLFGAGVAVGYRLAQTEDETDGTVVEVTDGEPEETPESGDASAVQSEEDDLESSGSWGPRLLAAGTLAGLGYLLSRRRASDDEGEEPAVARAGESPSDTEETGGVEAETGEES